MFEICILCLLATFDICDQWRCFESVLSIVAGENKCVFPTFLLLFSNCRYWIFAVFVCFLFIYIAKLFLFLFTWLIN